MKRTLLALVAGLLLAGVTTSAHAVVIVAQPTPVSVSTGLGMLKPVLGPSIVSDSHDMILTDAAAPNSPVLGKIYENVYMNTMGSLSGLLFTYDLTRLPPYNNEGYTLYSMTVRSFLEAATIDVGYFSDSTGTVTLDGVKLVGGNLEYSWSNLPDGTQLKTLYVQTNLQYLKPGQISIIGTGSNNYTGFAPTATPEPGTVALLGTGLLGLLGFRRKSTV